MHFVLWLQLCFPLSRFSDRIRIIEQYYAAKRSGYNKQVEFTCPAHCKEAKLCEITLNRFLGGGVTGQFAVVNFFAF